LHDKPWQRISKVKQERSYLPQSLGALVRK